MYNCEMFLYDTFGTSCEQNDTQQINSVDYFREGI